MSDENKEQLDHPAQVRRQGDTISVDLWYPGVSGNATHIEVELVHVRAADSIRIHYDFDRDGYVIEQASNFEGTTDGSTPDPDWQEVAFVQAWAREAGATPSPQTPAPPSATLPR